MRIAVDYRLISGDPNVVSRGTARYTQQQLREVLKLDHNNEYLLVCHRDVDKTLILPEILSAPNASIAYLPWPELKSGSQPNQAANVMRYTEQYQEWLYGQHVGLYHASAPYQLDEFVMPTFDVCPLVTTLYDLIPVVYPEHYWPAGKPFHEELTRALTFIGKSTRLIAISQSTAQDAAKYLGFPGDRIDIAYPFADPIFRVLPRPTVAAKMADLRRRLSIPETFIACLTHTHHSKNFESLLKAYARLPEALRRQLPIVSIFYLSNDDRRYLQALLEKYAIIENVIFTGLIPNDELVALFNAATMVVHPSRYEGFGLPVIEAMQCGAPVITTNAASLPEATGSAAILVEPDNTQALADAIEGLYVDPRRRDALRQAGLDQAKRFSPDQLGKNTLASYEAAAHPTPSAMSNSPLRVALWSSMPPLRCGIADYTVELLRHLARACEIEIFVDDGYLPALELIQAYHINHHSAFERRQRQHPFDTVLYQLGVSAMHDYMYPVLRRHPGIVVIHDVICASELYYLYRARGRLDAFAHDIVAAESHSARAEYGRALRQDGGVSGNALEAFFEKYWLLKWVLDNSHAQIVHMEYARHELERRYSNANVSVIPLMGIPNPVAGEPDSREAIREQYGVTSSGVIIGLFGAVARLKRVHSCLRAFARLLAAFPDSTLVIVGTVDYDPDYVQELLALSKILGIQERVAFLGRTSEVDLNRYLAASDVVVNLRYPPKIQMSAMLSRALASGKPVIISDIPEWRCIPDSCSVKIPAGPREVEALSEALLKLASDPDLRNRMSAAAWAYYKQDLVTPSVSEKYLAVVARVAGRSLVGGSGGMAPAQRVGAMGLNRPCEADDFADTNFSDLMRDLLLRDDLQSMPGGPLEPEETRWWGAVMAIRVLREAGQLRRDATILVIAAGTHPLACYLTRQVGQVFAIDRYLELGHIGRRALIDPEESIPYTADLNRLVMQIMDARVLRFPDESFDAVVLCPALRHLGSKPDMASAMYEMGRILKPGGVVSLTVDYLLAGPPGGEGWDSAKPVLSKHDLHHYVIEASGLELLDELCLEPSERTLTMPRRLDIDAQDITEDVTHPPQYVSVVRGYATVLLNMALRRTAAYPLYDNAWARPSPALIEKVRQDLAAATPTQSANPAPTNMPAPALSPPSQSTPAMNVISPDSLGAVRARLKSWSQIRLKGWYNDGLRRLPSPVAFLVRALARFTYLGHSQQAQEYLYTAFVDHLAALHSQLAESASHTRELGEQLQGLMYALNASQQELGQESSRRSAAEAELAGQLSESEAALTNALHASQQELGQELSRRSAAEAELAGRLSESEAALAAARSDLASLKADLGPGYITAQREHLARLEDQLRLNTSHVRLLSQVLNVTSHQGSTDPGALTPDELVELLQQLEQHVPALAAFHSVELSLQVSSSEALFAGTAYLGDRLSSNGSMYRSPNDLWYHVDFTADWDRSVLFDSAAVRLSPGGCFVLVTDPDHRAPAAHPLLGFMTDRAIQLASGKRLRAYLWRKQSEPLS